jgi:hypothetical protein
MHKIRGNSPTFQDEALEDLKDKRDIYIQMISLSIKIGQPMMPKIPPIYYSKADLS